MLALVFLLSSIKYLVALIRPSMTVDEFKDEPYQRSYSIFILFISFVGFIIKVIEACNNPTFREIWVLPYIFIFLLNSAIFDKLHVKLGILSMLVFNIYIYLVLTDKIYPLTIF